MDENGLRDLLQGIRTGERSIDEAVREIKKIPYKELGYAKVDHFRELRTGRPEVVFCQGKTTEQIAGIMAELMNADANILATRAVRENYEGVARVIPDAEYNETARTIIVRRKEITYAERPICVISAGTADLPVAEEACVTAEIMGNPIERLYDVGVAGIHRLLANTDRIDAAGVIIVVAGMEGALASVVGGMADKPVVAVPTSVGYGASFGGLAALLTMLNSCASGIGVVNIDNGFGAAVLASQINRLNLAIPKM